MQVLTSPTDRAAQIARLAEQIRVKHNRRPEFVEAAIQRRHDKQKFRKFTGEPMTGFGAL